MSILPTVSQPILLVKTPNLRGERIDSEEKVILLCAQTEEDVTLTLYKDAQQVNSDNAEILFAVTLTFSEFS